MNSVQAQQGVAPTIQPSGGCAIDGNLLSKTPTAAPFSSSDGDFLPNPGVSGTGGNIFTLEGAPVDSSIAFHTVDLYDANDAEIFTQGSKFNNDPNTWKWKAGKPPAKDDINNALFFFSNDTLGNLWFTACGDRKSTNGNTYLDFELLQNPLYKNPDGSFTSLGPDGGRTTGDLAITIQFINGGSNAMLYVYQWENTGPGSFSYVLITPVQGSAFLAMNKDSAVVVPFGAFGSGTYQVSAFSEVACNLNGLNPGMANCLDIKSVIVKTKASQSLNAELKDFITPIQLSGINSIPVVSVNSDTICNGDSATLSATVLSGGAPFTYLWNTGDTTPSITVSPDTTTQYFVVVTGGNGCQSVPDTGTVFVNPPPICFISGPDSICPLGSGEFFGPDSLASYLWTISGNGTIQGSNTGQSVIVYGNGGCDSVFTLSLLVTDTTGCTSTCTKIVSLLDHVSPVITNVPGPISVDCASQIPPPSADSVTVSDNCSGLVIVTVSEEITGQACTNQFTLIRTWTATDLCGNFDSASQIITVYDSIPPVLYGIPQDTSVSCASMVPDPAVVTATDNCEGIPDVAFNEQIISQTCHNQFTLVRTWTATDSCGNVSTASQVISVSDSLPPLLSGVPGDTLICCADSIPPPADVTAMDECDGLLDVTLTESISDSTGPNNFILTRIWTAVDSCNNIATDTTVITVDSTQFDLPGGIETPNGKVMITLDVSPNPFVNTANIRFSVSGESYVTLELFNTTGVKVKVLFVGKMTAGGSTTVTLSPGSSMGPGMYILYLRTDNAIKTQRIFLMR